MPGPKLVCLLPVRNGEKDLPGYFESVARFADAVIALDDGSTDGTRALLDRHPLVATVLETPPRDSYAGWDDAMNRNRLLEAAASSAGMRSSASSDMIHSGSTAAAASSRRFRFMASSQPA